MRGLRLQFGLDPGGQTPADSSASLVSAMHRLSLARSASRSARTTRVVRLGSLRISRFAGALRACITLRKTAVQRGRGDQLLVGTVVICRRQEKTV